LKDKLAKDELVYGGSSAGAMVATPDLRYYNDQKAKENPDGYDPEIVWEGLNLVDEYISPHYNDQSYARNYVADRIKRFEQDNIPHILLNDTDVYVVDGEKKEILRAK